MPVALYSSIFFFVSCHGSDTNVTAKSDSAFEITGFNSQKEYKGGVRNISQQMCKVSSVVPVSLGYLQS